MRTRLLAMAVVSVGVLVLVAREPVRVQACAPAPPRGGSVAIATETALIVWDAPAKTQHFIRTASFSSTSADFGFLVPTPSQPELAEADPAVFDELARWTAPRTVTRTKTAEFGCGAPIRSFTAVGAARPGGVEVLEEKRVGAFDAAVLRADDPTALRDWLSGNGYDARPELEGWLKWYVENRWIVTAFKIAVESKARKPDDGQAAPRLSVTGSAVRMSFKTDRPFFPYREPADQRADRAGPVLPRMLRVFLLAESRYDGTLGDGSQSWPGRTVWAGPVDRPRVATAAKIAKLPDNPADGLAGRDWWLTEFEDRASPRPGTDEVYFGPSPDQSAVERPPNVNYVYRDWPNWVGLTVVGAAPVIAIALIWLLFRRLGRRG